MDVFNIAQSQNFTAYKIVFAKKELSVPKRNFLGLV